jgi:hypothetical protein
MEGKISSFFILPSLIDLIIELASCKYLGVAE